MTPLKQIMENLGDQIRTYTGLGVYQVGEAGVFPCLFVPTPENIPYNDLAGGSYQAVFELPVMSGRSPDSLPQLADFVDPFSDVSVFGAVERDKTLGGLNVSASCTGIRGLEGDEVAGYQAYGHAVRVEIFVS